MINFIFCIGLPTWASKVVQTHKFDDFLNLTQFFPIWPDSVSVEIKVVRKDVMNIFEIQINSLRYIVFTPRTFEIGNI